MKYLKYLDGYKSLIGAGGILVAAFLDVFNLVDAAGMCLKFGGAILGGGMAHKLDKLIKLLSKQGTLFPNV